MTQEEYTLKQLANLEQTTPRTIRYYISKELLSPPLGLGRNATYNEKHRETLQKINALKQKGHTLREIKRIITTSETTPIIPEPTTWWSYQIAPDITLNIESTASPWRIKTVLDQMKILAEKLEEKEE